MGVAVLLVGVFWLFQMPQDIRHLVDSGISPESAQATILDQNSARSGGAFIVGIFMVYFAPKLAQFGQWSEVEPGMG